MYLLLIVLLLIGCNKQLAVSPENLHGKWKLKISTSHDGSSPLYSSNQEEITIAFDRNGKFSETVIDQQYSGRFTIRESNLRLMYKPADSVSLFEAEVTKNRLRLIPLTPEGGLACDEGCSSVYHRTD